MDITNCIGQASTYVLFLFLFVSSCSSSFFFISFIILYVCRTKAQGQYANALKRAPTLQKVKISCSQICGNHWTTDSKEQKTFGCKSCFPNLIQTAKELIMIEISAKLLMDRRFNYHFLHHEISELNHYQTS